MFRSECDLKDTTTNKQDLADCDTCMETDTDMNIFEAVKAGDCEQILTNISQINHINEDGDTPLLVAVQKRQLKVVKVLLDHGANIEAANKEGKTALHVAVKRGRLEIIVLLLDHGANIEATDKEGNVALYLAVMEAQLHITKQLLQRGANVNAASNIGSTPLIKAALNGFEDMVKLLLQHGADHSLGTEVDNTALCWASSKGHHVIAKILLDAGANPFHRTQNGASVLSIGKDESMKRLIREYQQLDGPSWLVRELSMHDLEWGVVYDTQDKLRKIGLNTKDALARSQLSDVYLNNVGIADATVRHVLLQIYYTVNGSSWLLQELSKRVAQWNLVSDVLHKLRSVGLDSRESLLRIPSARFTDAYLQDIGIDALTVRCALLDMRAQATWLGAHLVSEGESVANMILMVNFVVETLGCSTEEAFAALSEGQIQAHTTHLSVGACQSLFHLHKQVQSANIPVSVIRAAPAFVPAPLSTLAQAQAQIEDQAPANTSTALAPLTEAGERAMRDTQKKLSSSDAHADSDEDRPPHESLPPFKRSRLVGDFSLPHSTSDGDDDAAGDVEGEQQRDSEEGELVGGQE